MLSAWVITVTDCRRRSLRWRAISAVFGYSTITFTANGVTTTEPVVFGGEPTQAFWVSQLQSGQSPQEILAGILGASLIYNRSALVQPPN